MLCMADSSLLYGRIIKVNIGTGSGALQFNNDLLEIRFEVPFDEDSKPNISTVQIFNLTKNTINKIKKGKNITVIAGYEGDYGVLVEGKIESTLTKYSGPDKITTITFKEGTDYSGVKVTVLTADPAKKYYVKKRVNGKTVKVPKYRKQTMQITFANGTTAKQIITRLAGILGIKPTEVDLPRNKVYKTGYNVTGQIENNLVTVVKDCGARMYWRRGKMVIRSIKVGDDERFTLSEETGLIETPSEFEDDDEKGYTVRCLLQHRITTASIIDINSGSANGKYRARSGTHYYDGTDFVTDFEVI